MTAADPITALGGTLIRGADGWRWRDGVPEPRVRDLRGEWNFRCQTGTAIHTYVEVLASVARETESLAWVIEGARKGRYRTSTSGDHTGPLRIDESGARAMHIRPGEDPLHGAEPLPEVPGPIPRVILVPIEEWDRWRRQNPSGVEWDLEHEESILARARELGWGDPR